MKTTIEQKEPCLINLHIELPPEHFAREWSRTVSEYQKFADIPGFRKGKAPRASIEKKYSEKIINYITENSIKKALEEQQIKAFQNPEVKNIELRDDNSFYLLVTVMTCPEVQLKASDYSKLEVIVEMSKHDDKEVVQHYLETMQQKLSEYINIEGRGLIMGDTALIDYSWNAKGSKYLSALEDDPTFEAGFVSNYDDWYEMEKEEYIPGFSEAMLGMKPHEVRKFEVTFPNDFREEKLRGITVFYEVTLDTVNTKKILPIDDRLANAIMPGYTLKKLKKEACQSLQNLFDNRVELAAKELLKDKVVNNIFCELPSPVVANMKDAMVNDFIKKHKSGKLSSEEKTYPIEAFASSAEKSAVRELKWMFIAKAIAQKEGVELTSEEFCDYLEEVAEERNVDSKELLQELKHNGEFSVLYGQLKEEKVLDFIYSKAKVKVSVTLEEKKIIGIKEIKEVAKKVKK